MSEDRLREAADVIADDARRRAGTWSRKIPPSILVAGGGDAALVTASAPNARPAELRLRHPLFGNRRYWYGPPGSAFLVPAAEARIEDAAMQYAKVTDDWAKRDGFK